MKKTRKWNGKSTYRLDNALREARNNRAALNTVQQALKAAEKKSELEAAEHIVNMMQLNVPASDLALGHGWECENSPTEHCIYIESQDSWHDSCIVCGQPSERK